MAETPHFKVLELTAEERQAFLGRVSPGCVVGEQDYRLIEGIIVGLPDVLALIDHRGMTISRLRQLVFGARTEKTATVCPAPAATGGVTKALSPPPPKPKRKGHGRHGADAYPGARRVRVPHPQFHGGEPCPNCLRGKLHLLRRPGVVVRIVGQAPLAATLFELEKFRCATCGQVFSAPAPAAAGTAKYDPTVAALVALLRFGSGVPSYRLAQLQQSLGIPFPASTQWELAAELAQAATPAFECLARQAAQRGVIHNDDTTMRVASLRREPAPLSDADDPKRARTGIFTTGILTGGDEPPIALFFTGHRHAGENLQDLLDRRDRHLPAPIQSVASASVRTGGFGAISEGGRGSRKCRRVRGKSD